MLKGLGNSKTDFEKKLYNIFYNACNEIFNDSLDSTDPNTAGVAAAAKIVQHETSKKFADKIAGDLASAIYNYIMEIRISATPVGTLMSPGGMSPAPCTGQITPEQFEIK